MTDVKAYEPPTIKHRDVNDDPERVLIFSIEHPNPRAGQPIEPSEEAGYETGRVEPATLATDYTMPAKPNMGLALAYLKKARHIGTELAGSWLIEEALGSEGYDALAAEPDLTSALIETITEKIQKVALGGLEGPKGS